MGDGVCNDDLADGTSLLTSDAGRRIRNVYNLQPNVTKFVRGSYGQLLLLYTYVLVSEIRFHSNKFLKRCLSQNVESARVMRVLINPSNAKLTL